MTGINPQLRREIAENYLSALTDAEFAALAGEVRAPITEAEQRRAVGRAKAAQLMDAMHTMEQQAIEASGIRPEVLANPADTNPEGV
jgi:hypothetical protein